MFKLFIFFILFVTNVKAFINIESLRQNSDIGFNTSSKFLFNQQTGNTEKMLASASSFNSYEEEFNEYIFIATIQYGESFDQKDTDNGNLHLRYTRKLYLNHAAEFYTQYEYNKFKALNSRRLFGLGHRYTSQYINIGFGLFNEDEKIKNMPNENGIRGNAYISSSLKNPTGLEFATILYVQPSLKMAHDTRTILNAGISQKITKNTSLSIEYQNIYDQSPPDGIKSSDSSIMFGLTFN